MRSAECRSSCCRNVWERRARLVVKLGILRVEARRGEAPTAILFSVVVDHVVQLTPPSVDDAHATCGEFIGLLHACRVASFDDGHFIVVHKTL